MERALFKFPVENNVKNIDRSHPNHSTGWDEVKLFLLFYVHACLNVTFIVNNVVNRVQNRAINAAFFV